MWKPRDARTPGMTGAVCLALLPLALLLACAPYQEMWTHPDLAAASAASPAVEADTVKHRLILFGDGGASDVDPSDPAHLVDPTLRALAMRASEIPNRTTVAVLGDTVYPQGMPPSGPDYAVERALAEGALAAQLAAITSGGADAVLVAGNHDWKYGKDGVSRQAEMAHQYAADEGYDVRFAPDPGEPGPVVIDIGLEIRLVALDTQWWLHGDHPTAEEAGVREGLKAAIASAGSRRVVVVAHHPVASHGPHGGFHDLRTRFGLPVPSPIVGGVLGAVIGGVLSLVKGEFWPLPFALYGGALAIYMPTDDNFSELHGIASRGQDIRTPPYQHMLSVFGEAFAEGKPFIYASGHDHILEVLDGGAMAGYLLVSGSGSKTSSVKHGAGTLFDAYGEGFMIVDFLKSGGVTLTVVTTDDAPDAGAVVFTMQLDD